MKTLKRVFNKKISLALGLTALLIFFPADTTGSNKQRQKYNFNMDWRVSTGDPQNAADPNFDDEGWMHVTLPYSWNQVETFRRANHDLSTGVAWYRKTFRLPTSAKGQKIFVEFEGVRQAAEIYVNGQKVALHENGVMAFGLDLTPYVNFGKTDNVIALRTDSNWDYREKATGVRFQWNYIRFNASYGGIPKNVWLHITGPVYQTLPLYSNLGTTGVYIYATDFDTVQKRIQLNVESQVKNEGKTERNIHLEVEVWNPEGQKIGSFKGPDETVAPGVLHTLKASAELQQIEFWSWGYGYLYDITTRIVENETPLDEISTRTGFRKTAFKNGMVFLNDRVLMMKGYAQRSTNEWPSVGSSVPPWMSDFSNKLMVKSNANLVRWMHVTPWKQDVESADRVGLIQAMPAGDAEADASGRQWTQRVELMRDAIIYNRNNPSVLFYEGGNEAISEEHMADLIAVRDQYDPHGGRAMGSREMLDSKKAEWGGEMLYINKSAGHPMWATEYSRDEGLRKYWDNYSYPYHKNGDGPLYRNKDASEYNHNQDSHAIENVRRWFDYWEMRPGTGRRVSSGGVNIVFSDTHTHYRGAENYRRSGEVDAMRIPKDNYFAHQVMWDGWVENEQEHTHIIGHWNYADTVRKDIHVVSSGQQVELFVNGKSQGMGRQRYRFLYTFEQINFEPGNLRAVSYDQAGNKLSSDERHTVGAPYALQLTLRQHPHGMRADGADMALIDVEVVDQQGRRCPLANDLVEFYLKGPAEWIGGIAQGHNNFTQARQLPVEAGVNRVMVRAGTQKGKISVQAKAKGLQAALVEWESQEVDLEHGLSKHFPAEGLPANLERGPTPSGPSTRTTRLPVAIQSARTSHNNETAFYSFDDNELTEWRNDGRMNTALITYQLEREATLSECVLKLTGWRMREYPIRILVNGQTVYNGTTPRSLGYVTLPLEAVKGDLVTIALVGANTEKDAFGHIQELDSNQELDLFHDPNAQKMRGQLRIIEVEFYEAVN